MIKEMTNGMNFYKLKFEFMAEAADGKLYTKKQETLVVAVNYTDAEKIATKMMEGMTTYDSNVGCEIVKTKISEFILTDTFEIEEDSLCGLTEYYFSEEDTVAALFCVNIVYTEVDKNDKERTSKGDLYVAASSPKEAFDFASKYLSKVEMRDWVIRNVKFDKADSIAVTSDMHKNYVFQKTTYGL